MHIDHRPTSPHLQIYRPHLIMVMSIMHRITGVILSVAVLALVYWLLALARGPEAFARAEALLHGWPGLLLLFGTTLALFYHLSTGIRHLVWDTGIGYELKNIYLSCKLVLISTTLLTALFWLFLL